MPVGHALSVSAEQVLSALKRAKSRGMEPVRVLCPFRVNTVTGEAQLHKVTAREIFGVELGLASELVVLPGNGCLAVWGDRE